MGWRNERVEGLGRVTANGRHLSNVTRCVPILCMPWTNTSDTNISQHHRSRTPDLAHLVLSPPAPCATLSSRRHYSTYPAQSSPPSSLLTIAYHSIPFTTGSMRNIVVSATLQYVPRTVIPTILAADHCVPLNPALARNDYTNAISSRVAFAMTPQLGYGQSCALGLSFFFLSCLLLKTRTQVRST
jgi:hypothetical protein